MSASINLGTAVTQAIPSFGDTYSNMQGRTMCGSQQYTISAPATTIILTNTIQVKSSNKAQAGTQQVSLLVTLSSYQTITLSVPFTVNLIYL